MKKKEIVLPTLPYGKGNFSWMDKGHTRIRFRKRINGKYKSVTGSTVQECNKKMKAIESAIIRQEKERQLNDPQNNALTRTQSKGKAYGTMNFFYHLRSSPSPGCFILTMPCLRKFSVLQLNEKLFSL